MHCELQREIKEDQKDQRLGFQVVCVDGRDRGRGRGFPWKFSTGGGLIARRLIKLESWGLVIWKLMQIISAMAGVILTSSRGMRQDVTRYHARCRCLVDRRGDSFV